jgi:preprotein translocase subunit SecA
MMRASLGPEAASKPYRGASCSNKERTTMGDSLKQWGIKKLSWLDPARKALERGRARAEAAGRLEQELTALDDAAFDAKLAEFRAFWTDAFKRHGGEDAGQWARAQWPGKEEAVARLMALAREVSRRQLGMRHFDSQLIGASLLMEGCLAEMATGEGKTLVAPVAALHDALAGLNVHIVTVNTYLADRDARQMAPFFGRFGLSTGLLVENAPSAIKQEAYGCDVVYGVNHEFGFDYLRDQLARTPQERVQRGLRSAFIDEVDSILIDEARTPLILSGQQDEDLRAHLAARDIVEALPSQWVEVEEKERVARASERAFAAIEEGFVARGWIKSGHNLYEGDSMALLRAAQAALNARFIYKKDQHYIVRDGEVMIVDDFTGRAMEGRRWSDGLHQAVEAKERVAIQQDSKTLATITYQNYFRLYQKIAGMTGTAMTQAPEFWSVYGLRVAQAPTNKPVARRDLPDAVYRTREEKLLALVEQAKEARDRSQPVLIGTSNIEDAEEVSVRLAKAGLPHEALTAKNHAREAAIIAEAGRPGAITVATNMAGRGADIALGGSLRNALERIDPADPLWEQKAQSEREAWSARRQQALDAGGLLVLGSSRHESRRIDNQLRGRSGRQGDPGASKFLLSLEDELFRVYANSPVMGLLSRSTLIPFGAPLEHASLTRALEKAQGRVEGLHAEMRQQALDYDNVANDQRRALYDWRAHWIDGKVDLWEELFEFGAEAVQAAAEEALQEAGGWPENVEWDRLDELVSERLGGVAAPEWPVEESERWTPENWPTMLAQAAVEEWREAFSLAIEVPWSRSAILAPMVWALDEAWQDHLTALSGMRELIHLRSYAQADPKREYQREAMTLFKRMRARVSAESAAVGFPVAAKVLGWELARQNGEEVEIGAVLWSAPALDSTGPLDPFSTSLGPFAQQPAVVSAPQAPLPAETRAPQAELAEPIADAPDQTAEEDEESIAMALQQALQNALDEGLDEAESSVEEEAAAQSGVPVSEAGELDPHPHGREVEATRIAGEAEADPGEADVEDLLEQALSERRPTQGQDEKGALD